MLMFIDDLSLTDWQKAIVSHFGLFVICHWMSLAVFKVSLQSQTKGDFCS